MKTTIYELLGMIKDGKAPKRIKYGRYTYWFCETAYHRENGGIISGNYLGEDFRLDLCLNDEVEILDEDKKDKEIEVYINGEKVDITDIYEPLKQGEYFYKENDKWYVHKLKNVSFVIEEDKKIIKIKEENGWCGKQSTGNEIILKMKVNELIDEVNKLKENNEPR